MNARKAVFFVLVLLLTLSAIVSTAAAQPQPRRQAEFRITFEIINADTFQTIRPASTHLVSVSTGNRSNERAWAQSRIRRNMGFPANSDTRTAGGVNQRIVWIDITPLN